MSKHLSGNKKPLLLRNAVEIWKCQLFCLSRVSGSLLQAFDRGGAEREGQKSTAGFFLSQHFHVKKEGVSSLFHIISSSPSTRQAYLPMLENSSDGPLLSTDSFT